MDEQNLNILERIHAFYYQLTASERKVADFVLANHERVQFMSITQLAEECGTADATISRFCRNLDLKGFNAFKIELARYSSPAPQKRRTAPTKDTIMGRCLEVGRMANDAVYQTMELLDPDQVTQAVSLFEEADRVVCIGSGGSLLMAKEFAHLFSTVTHKFMAISDAHMQMSAVATSQPKDVLVLFSYSGATTSGVEIMEQAKKRNMATVVITRYPKSPAAELADVVLRCGSNEGPFQFGSVPAKIAQLIVMDVLFQEYRHRNPEASEESIQNIGSALAHMHI